MQSSGFAHRVKQFTYQLSYGYAYIIALVEDRCDDITIIETDSCNDQRCINYLSTFGEMVVEFSQNYIILRSLYYYYYYYYYDITNV